MNNEIDQARDWLQDAEYVLFSAGAGMTAAAGINYVDTKLFAREFPAMLQYGFTAQYQFIGYNDWKPELQWGYWAAHVDLVRFKWPEAYVYKKLRKLATHVQPEKTFVMTSNVDAMFERNGFDAQRIFTPQGDYAYLQCTTPCTQTVWPWKAQIDKIRGVTDPKTQLITDSSLIPFCPNCGGTVFPNVRGDNSFVDDHFNSTSERLERWLFQAKSRKGVVIEIGAGFNTPSVIRWPNESLVHFAPQWKLIRINLTDTQIPNNILGRAVGLQGDALDIINDIQNR